MVWTYHEVEQLRKKYFQTDEEITVPEIRRLEKYVMRKKKFKDKPGNHKKHIFKAESLLRRLKKQNEKIIEVEH